MQNVTTLKSNTLAKEVDVALNDPYMVIPHPPPHTLPTLHFIRFVPHQELETRLHQLTRDLSCTRSELSRATSQVCEQRANLERMQR